MLQIESRNVDGVRLTHQFRDREAFLEDAQSDDPVMGDNEILLVLENGVVLFCSLNRPKPKGYEDTVRTADLQEWLSPTWIETD